MLFAIYIMVQNCASVSMYVVFFSNNDIISKRLHSRRSQYTHTPSSCFVTACRDPVIKIRTKLLLLLLLCTILIIAYQFSNRFYLDGVHHAL